MSEWRDKNTLKSLYNAEKMSQKEIADELGCSQATVNKWMKKHNIKARDQSIAISMAFGPLSLKTTPDGYEVFRTHVNGEYKHMLHHRLLAIAENGIGAVKGNVVHHKNGIRWDNRPSNIEIMTDSSHKSHHANEFDRKEGKFHAL